MDPSSSSTRHPRSDSLHASASSSPTVRPTSRQHHDPATPAQSDTPGDEYFDTLSTAPSRRSRLSIRSLNLSRPVSAAASNDGNSNADRSRRPSIRIRRSSFGLTGGQQPHSVTASASSDALHQSRHDSVQGSRPRSISQPGPAPPVTADGTARARNSRRLPSQIALPRLTEEGARPSMAELGLSPEGTPLSPAASAHMGATLERSHSAGEVGVGSGDNRQRRRSIMGRLLRPGLRRSSAVAPVLTPEEAAAARRAEEYNEELVDWLDIIDPEVQTLSTLTNVQNSLFVPDLGSWVNRRPTYILSAHDPTTPRPPTGKESAPPPEEPTIQEEVEEEDRTRLEDQDTIATQRIRRSNTITSRLSDSHYAALPHGETLEGWSAAEKWELDDHVRHMLHSRRSKFKQQMKGFGQYVRRPLGFFVTLYATLITLFGLAWVLFLIGWIYVGDQQVYAIHIIDSVLVALFAVMGDGLAPFRAVDTYHMIFIARYARIIATAKKKAAKVADEESESRTNIQIAGSPDAEKSGEPDASANHATTATPTPSIAVEKANNGQTTGTNADDEHNDMNIDLEEDANSTTSACSLEEDYLTPKQRKSLAHHQKKLAKSHSFYKPHETFTHHAFPLGHLIAIIILLDCHSCLQISLGATTWGIDYHHRPFAITTVILCVSITCNLTAGLVIMFGDRKTRKQDVVDLLKRQALTGDAMKKVEKKRNRGQDTDSEGILTGQSSANN